MLNLEGIDKTDGYNFVLMQMQGIDNIKGSVRYQDPEPSDQLYDNQKFEKDKDHYFKSRQIFEMYPPREKEDE